MASSTIDPVNREDHDESQQQAVRNRTPNPHDFVF
jgi:hypothetical protein